MQKSLFVRLLFACLVSGLAFYCTDNKLGAVNWTLYRRRLLIAVRLQTMHIFEPGLIFIPNPTFSVPFIF